MKPATLWAVLSILLAGLLAYANSFGGPLVFDDHDVIEQNPSIRSWRTAFSPPKADGMTTSGRPVANASLALNYAFGGTSPRGYHVVNLAIHLAAAAVLFGVLRRTFERAGHARPVLIAWMAALLWTVHPLQTAAVTYIAQRAESLVSLFYLLTLYCFARAAGRMGDFRFQISNPWLLGSVLCCAAGMATKEVMVSAPLIVLLYDRTFVAGSFAGALRARWGYHVALFATLLLLAWFLVQSGGRGATAGADAGVAWWAYALKQAEAVMHYLRLVVWPAPLIFDHGIAVPASAAAVALPLAAVALLVAASVYALWRRPAIGFAAAFFFCLLAPSSSVVPVATQTMAEHRMYLALAAPLALLCALCLNHRGTKGRSSEKKTGISRDRPSYLRASVVQTTSVLFAAAVLGVLTFQRNKVYASELSLWEDTVRQKPENGRAHANLGKALSVLGRDAEAAVALAEAVRLGPPLASVHFNLGLIAEAAGRPNDAVRHYEEALAVDPEYAPARLNRALHIDAAGRPADALRELEQVARTAPDFAEGRMNLGILLAKSGRTTDALPHFEAAVRLAPELASAHYTHGSALFALGRLPAALQAFETAARLDPEDPFIRYNQGIVLGRLNRPAEAAAAFREALRLRPNFPEAQRALSALRP